MITIVAFLTMIPGTKPLIPFMRTCGNCRDDMVEAPTQSSPGGCDVPTRRCEYAQVLPGDGLDRNGEIDPVNQCDTPNLSYRRAKPGTIHDIPDDFIKNPGKYRVSQCHIAVGRDPSTWDSTGRWKDVIAKEMERCGYERYGRAGINVILDHKHRITDIGGCNTHCNDLIVIATAPGVRCHGTSSSTATTATTTTPETTTIDQAITALQERLAQLAEKVAQADATLDVAGVQKEIKLIQAVLEGMQTEITDVITTQQGFQTQINSIKDHQAKMQREMDALGRKPSAFLPTGTGCIPGSSECVPTLAADGQGNLDMVAKDGTVMFETGSCAPTDLCELSLQLRALLDKLS